MNKKYIVHQLKHLAPLYGVFLIILFTSMIGIITDNNGLYTSFYSTSIPVQTNPVLSLFIITIIFTFITPFFAYSYRFATRKADLYNQLPFKNNGLKVTNLIIHIVLTAICFITVATIAMGFMYMNQVINNPYYTTSYGYDTITDVTIIFYYNYGWFFLAILLYTVFIAIEQIINHFIASKANNVGDCFLYLAMFFTIRLIGLYDIVCYMPRSIGMYSNNYDLLANYGILSIVYLNLTPISIGFLIHYLTGPGLTNYAPGLLFNNRYTYELVFMFVSVFLYIGLGIYAFINQLLFKDKHQENFGRKRNKTWFDYLLPHVFMLSIMVASLMPSTYVDVGILTLLSLNTALVGYYGILAIVNRHAKLNKKDWFTALGQVVIWAILLFNYAYSTTVYYDNLVLM